MGKKNVMAFLLSICLMIGMTGCTSEKGVNTSVTQSGEVSSDHKETASEENASQISEGQGLPVGLNSPNMDEWSNIVGDNEYYVTQDQRIAQRKTDGYGETVISELYHSASVWAMPEGLLYTTSTDQFCFSNLDGSQVKVLDEDVSNGYTSVMIDDNYIYYYQHGDTGLQKILDRKTLEPFEIPESMVNDYDFILMIDDQKFYYFRSSDSALCCCDLNGENEVELMTLSGNLIFNNDNKVVIINGDTYLKDSFSDCLYKFPAGISEATEDMKLDPPEGKGISGYKIRNGVIYCSEKSGDSFFKMDLDGNYLGDCTREEWRGE